ncbi:zinc finger protein 660-like [Ochlerotatus camptorhynchus]|uniref:zinc finger protein 660-like n=1 Tax=Ochlerotatus camptorhynchus TaxID=644619 RepID=UPI0031D51900
MAINKIKKERSTESICRLCFAEREHFQLIFIDEYSSLNEWIENLTSLKIMNVPNVPASLCIECENTLRNFESFREMCFTNDRVIKEMFSQDNPKNDHTEVSNNMSTVREVKIDHSEIQETDIMDTTISDVDNTETTIVYSDIKIEDASLLNSEDNTAENESSPDIKDDTQDDLKFNHNEVSSNVSEVSEVQIDHREIQETDILNTTISEVVNTKIRIEYPAIKIEDASLLNSEDNNDDNNAENESSSDTEEDLELEKSQSLVQTVTKNKKAHICSLCDKGFKNATRLKIHIRSHTQERPFKCKDCGKSFTTHSNLKRHIQGHNGLKPYSCDMCPASYYQSSHLLSHRSVHEELGHMSTQNDTEGNETSWDTEHVQEYEKSESLAGNSNCTKDKRKYCLICKIFVHRMTQHQLIHKETRPFKCEYCSNGFAQMYKLRMHIRKHTQEKPYICGQCNKGFTNSANLRIHIRSHTQERPYQCKNCGKAFITSGHLLRHSQTHSGLKPFVCDVCQGRFAQKSHLARHKRVHAKLIS